MNNRFALLLKMFLIKFKGKNPIYELFMKDKKILDLACGLGELLKMNKELIYGVDLNETLVSSLQKDGCLVSLSSVTKIPFENNFFDVVNCSNIIEHLNPEDAQKMFLEMKRVLRPGGYIFLKTPMPKTIWNSFGHLKPYPPKAIRKLFRSVSLEKFDSIEGLNIENVIYFGSNASNSIVFIISSLIANISPCLRGSYLMKIKKQK